MQIRRTVFIGCVCLGVVACREASETNENNPGDGGNQAMVQSPGRDDRSPTGPATVGDNGCPDREPVPVETLDLLVVMDNSGSMREKQAAFREQLPRMLRALTSGDVDGDGQTEFTPLRSLHLGVVSTDMGLVGIEAIPGCSGLGDDGILNAIPNAGVEGCQAGAPSYPSFLDYMPGGGSTPEQSAADFACLTSLGTDGCGFEQQLEAMLKALWRADDVDPATGYAREHNRITFLGDREGNGQSGHGDRENLNFLRIDPRAGRSLLAVLMLTDEEDCSSSDTRHFTPDIYLDPADPLASQDLNLRCFYNPQNLYPINRYVDGLKALRPGAEHLVVFGAIAGVPPELVDAAAQAQLDHEDPSALDAHYEAVLADPAMEERVDPDRPPQAGGNLLPVCTYGEETTLRAYPARRITQVVQGFGSQGMLGSICQSDLDEPIDVFLQTIARTLKDAEDPGIPGVCDPILTPIMAPTSGSTTPGGSAPQVGRACLPAAMPPGGFSAADVALEPGHAQCAGDDCIVFHLGGDPYNQCAPNAPPASQCVDPAEVAARVYCTCQCWSPIGGPTCLCPEAFTCLDSARAAASLPGGYCIRDGTF